MSASLEYVGQNSRNELSALCAKLTARVKDRPNAFNYNNGFVTRLSLFIWDHSP